MGSPAKTASGTIVSAAQTAEILPIWRSQKWLAKSGKSAIESSIPTKGSAQATLSVRPSSSAAHAAPGVSARAAPNAKAREVNGGFSGGRRLSLRRRHHDLDRVLRRGELRLDGRAGRRVAGRNPRVPDRVHLVEGRHVGKPDIRRQELRLVGAGLGEQAVDDRQDLLGLLGDAPAC